MDRHGYLDTLAAAHDVLAHVLHELNNPMAALSGYLQLARRTTDAARLQEYVRLCAEQVDGYRRVVDRFEEALYVRPPRVQPVTAADVVAVALGRRTAAAAEAGVVLSREVADEAVQVNGDLDLLSRAYGKLVDNAIEAVARVAEPRRVVAGVSCDGGTLRLTVDDTGPGVPEALWEAAFDPTYTTRRSGRGTGFGLPTALAIARRQGGDVELQLSPLGGTRAILSLPVLVPVAPESRRRVLCVDDEVFILDLYEDVLSGQGIEIVRAQTVAEATAALADPRIDQVVCDFRLPDGTASTLMVAAATVRPDLASHWVVCTGDPSQPDVATCLRAFPAARLLAKPFSIQDLIQRTAIPRKPSE